MWESFMGQVENWKFGRILEDCVKPENLHHHVQTKFLWFKI